MLLVAHARSGEARVRPLVDRKRHHQPISNDGRVSPWAERARGVVRLRGEPLLAGAKLVGGGNGHVLGLRRKRGTTHDGVNPVLKRAPLSSWLAGAGLDAAAGPLLKKAPFGSSLASPRAFPFPPATGVLAGGRGGGTGARGVHGDPFFLLLLPGCPRRPARRAQEFFARARHVTAKNSHLGRSETVEM